MTPMTLIDAQTAASALRAALPYARISIVPATMSQGALPEADRRYAVELETLLCHYRTSDAIEALTYARAGGNPYPRPGF